MAHIILNRTGTSTSKLSEKPKFHTPPPPPVPPPPLSASVPPPIVRMRRTKRGKFVHIQKSIEVSDLGSELNTSNLHVASLSGMPSLITLQGDEKFLNSKRNSHLMPNYRASIHSSSASLQPKTSKCPYPYNQNDITASLQSISKRNSSRNVTPCKEQIQARRSHSQPPPKYIPPPEYRPRNGTNTFQDVPDYQPRNSIIISQAEPEYKNRKVTDRPVIEGGNSFKVRPEYRPSNITITTQERPRNVTVISNIRPQSIKPSYVQQRSKSHSSQDRPPSMGEGTAYQYRLEYRPKIISQDMPENQTGSGTLERISQFRCPKTALLKRQSAINLDSSQNNIFFHGLSGSDVESESYV